MTDGVTVTLQMPFEQRAALEDLARSQHRDAGDLVTEAVAEFLAAHAGWEEHLRRGLQEAEAGDIAGADEVAAAFGFRPGRG